MTKNIKILFLLLIISNVAFGHKNTYFKKKYGNIELVSSTYYYTEDINKNLIIGQYAEKLSELLKYNESIQIYLNQDSTIKIYTWQKDINQKDESASLNIMINSPEKDVTKCLNFIEKSILNRDKIQLEKINFQNWYESNDLSINVQEVLKIKIYRPNDIEQLPKTKFFDYYFQNNNFHVISTVSCAIRELDTFTEILQFVEPKYYVLCVFTKMNALQIFEASCKYNFEEKNYYLESHKTELKIEKRADYFTSFRPYKISSLGKSNITLESMWGEDLYLYSLSKKIFINDLEKQIEK
ncbi:hypothetical protein [Flavobacterium sp.]|jgi:hypothetical protein|uniref:hypothetical protein n=1 Tax=Flavobacterium sp. TaxID=239 RepID=UPI0037BF3ACC